MKKRLYLAESGARTDLSGSTQDARLSELHQGNYKRGE